MHAYEALHRTIFANRLSLAMEAHSALSALIAERVGFPVIWASGLTLSSVHGLRDANELSWSQVFDALSFIVDRVDAPVLLDADSGYGDFNVFRRLVKGLHRLGVAGVAIEDKIFPKRNSFTNLAHQLASKDEFCGKIRAARDSLGPSEMMIVARTEGFILGRPLAEILDRCHAYVEAGAEAVFVHSKRNDPSEILAFCDSWTGAAPVIAAPTTYGSSAFEELEAAGVRLAICANQNLRASMRAMFEVCRMIRDSDKLAVVEPHITPLSDLFQLLDYEELGRAETAYLP